MLPNVLLPDRHRIVWTPDVPAALDFYASLLPDAAATLHPSRRYAELVQDGRRLVLAVPDLMARAGRLRVARGVVLVARSVQRVVTAARDAGARVAGDALLDPSGVPLRVVGARPT